MNNQLLYPMFAMFLLIFAVAVRMFVGRVRAVKSGQVKTSYFRLYNQGEIPDELIQASRHFSNLFEVPILFFVVCILGIIFNQGMVFLILAWLYVLARMFHAFIHLGRNRLGPRMKIYGLSWLILILMWVVLMWSQMRVESFVG